MAISQIKIAHIIYKSNYSMLEKNFKKMRNKKEVGRKNHNGNECEKLYDGLTCRDNGLSQSSH